MKPDSKQETSFVFTLTEDKPIENKVSQTKFSGTENEMPDWARNLEEIRQHKKNKTQATVGTAEAMTKAKPASASPLSAFAQQRRQSQQTAQNYLAKEDTTRIKKSDDAAATEKVVKKSTFVLDPVQREYAYQAYLQQWQQQVNNEAKKQEATLNDSAVLLQEDWLAAQSCLQTAPVDNNVTCTVVLQRHKPAQVITSEHPIADPDPQAAVAEQHPDVEALSDSNSHTPIHVHLHVIEPRGLAGRAVTCLSEQALLQQLTDKLRPHLSDVLAGMVRVAVQRHTASLIANIQKELMAEIPTAVDEILQYNLTKIMKNIKQNKRGI